MWKWTKRKKWSKRKKVKMQQFENGQNAEIWKR